MKEFYPMWQKMTSAATERCSEAGNWPRCKSSFWIHTRSLCRATELRAAWKGFHCARLVNLFNEWASLFYMAYEHIRADSRQSNWAKTLTTSPRINSHCYLEEKQETEEVSTRSIEIYFEIKKEIISRDTQGFEDQNFIQRQNMWLTGPWLSALIAWFLRAVDRECSEHWGKSSWLGKNDS